MKRGIAGTRVRQDCAWVFTHCVTTLLAIDWVHDKKCNPSAYANADAKPAIAYVRLR